MKLYQFQIDNFSWTELEVARVIIRIYIDVAMHFLEVDLNQTSNRPKNLLLKYNRKNGTVL